MNNFLMWVAGILAATLFALFAVPPLVDWNQYRGAFEEEVSRLLGREVRVGGAVNLRLLPVPYVGFEKVSIADAPGIPGAFLRAERFTMLLSVPPLLRGVVEARQLEVDSPVVRLRFDENGGGNWQTLEVRQQDLAFVPTDISLQSAQIRDGQIWLENARGEDIGRISNITGELVASALRGPYKFAGDVSIAGVNHQLRLATADADINGDIQIQGTATVPSAGKRHTLQGRISNLSSSPTLSGNISTSAPLTFGAKGAAAPTAKYDLTTSINLNSERAILQDLTVSFDSGGRPQQLNGKAQISWQSGIRIVGTLSSKWLDLDSITGGATKAKPLRVLDLLAGNTFDFGRTVSSRIELAIGQTNLGSAVISDVAVRLIQNDGILRADRISAALPGGTRLRAGGTLPSSSGNNTGWQGHVLLRGANLDRFANWARPGAMQITGKAAGAFKFSGNTTSSDTEITVSDAAIEFSGHASRGTMAYAWGEKPMLQVDWDADELDLSSFGEEVASPKYLAQLLGYGPAPAGKLTGLAEALRQASLRVRLRARRISDGNNVLSDVDALLSRDGDKLKIGRTTVTLEPGLELEIEGNVWGRAQAPEWSLAGLVNAKSAKSRRHIGDIVNSVIGNSALPDHLGQIFPARLAFTTKSTGKDEERTTAFEADGSVQSERLRLTLKNSGAIEQWHSQPLKLEAKVDGQSIRTALALFGVDTSDAAIRQSGNDQAAITAVPSFLRLTVSGIPNRELRAAATIANDNGNLRFRAVGRPDGTGKPLIWTGDGRFAMSDTARTIGSLSNDLAHVVPQAVASGGHFEFQRAADRLIVEPVDVRFGNSQVAGRLELRPATGERTKPSISGELKTSLIDGQALAALLLRKGSADSRAPAAQDKPLINETEDGGAFWPDRPFDLQLLARFDGDLKISSSRVRMTPELSLRDAKFGLNVSSGNLQITEFSGNLRGGKVSGNGALVAESAGAKFDASLQLSALPLEQFVAPGLRARVGGKMSGSLSMAGQALSPRALMTTLRGGGQLALTSVRLPGINVKTLSAIADEVVVGTLEPAGLSERIGAAARQGAIGFGRKAVKVSLADGTLQLASFTHGASGARSRNETTVDLVRMLVDSQWQIDTVLERSLEKSAASQKKQMPPVQIVYTGPLSRLSEIEPSVSIGDLQRELTVRRMEHDVRRLERLRREDEERAKAEAARLERQRLEQLKALEEEARKRNLSNSGDQPAEPGTIIINGQPGSNPSGEVPPAPPPQDGQPLPPAGGVLPSSADIAGTGATAASAAPGETLPAAGPPAPRSRPRQRKPKPEKWNPFESRN